MNTIGLAILAATGIVVAMIGGLPVLFRASRRSVRVGDRLRLSGGYDSAPRWLGTRDSIDGDVLALDGGNEAPQYAVIRLTEPISFEGLSSDIVTLRLRFKNARWGDHGTVHVELWRDVPERGEISSSEANDRRRWIESHATYRRLMRP